MNPTVSIIVPVYNAEETISRCIESILNQEYRDFELLLMNDGSADSSGDICDRYAKDDPRIRVIHKSNTGVSETRNMALDLACGTYLQFLDSDDWITPNATQLFVETANRYHCDMVISDFYRVVGKRVAHKGDIEDDCVLTQEEFASHMLQNPADFYYGVLWNKLYKREIVEKYKLRMDPNISWCEDFMFNLEYIRHAEVFYALQVPIYYYVKTKGSLASQGTSITKTIKMKLMVFEYYNNFYKHVLNEEDYEKNRLQVYRFLVDAAGDGAVPPSFFANSKKLGKERNSVNQELLSGEGILMNDYRDRKLMDYYLEPIAQKNDLTLKEVRLLLYLSELRHTGTRQEIADFAGITIRSLTLLLQRLSLKNLIKTEEIRSTQQLKIIFLPLASPILGEIAAAQCNYDQARYADFSEDELIQYAALNEKIKKNIQQIL